MELAFLVGGVVGIVIGVIVGYAVMAGYAQELFRERNAARTELETAQDDRDHYKALLIYWQGEALDYRNLLTAQHLDDQVEWRLTDAGRKLAEGVE